MHRNVNAKADTGLYSMILNFFFMHRISVQLWPTCTRRARAT